MDMLSARRAFDLRITAPEPFGRQFVAPLVIDFLAERARIHRFRCTAVTAGAL